MIALRYILLLCLSTGAIAEDGNVDGNKDPWEPFNRRVFKFNEFADSKILKPVAKGYSKSPRFVRRRIGNFFANLEDVNNSVNNILQGKIGKGLSDFTRLLVNTTIGLGGLFDPASKMGLNKHEEDFGQTFAKWGVPSGPYVVLPLFGPSTIRDALGKPFDAATDPVTYLEPDSHRIGLYALRFVDMREGLLDAEKAIFGEKYIFLRDAYLQRRNYLIRDGEVEDPFAEDF